MPHIWRLQSVWLGKENTSWTQVSAWHWLPKVSWYMKPVFEKSRDDWAYWVIDEAVEFQVAREMTQTQIDWVLRDDFAWLLLLAAFGTLNTTGSDPYTHAFTRKNDNAHPSLTVHWTDSVGSFYSAYSMLDELNLTAQVWDYVRFSASLMGKKRVSESTPTVTLGTENPFRARDVKVYFADNEAWLAGASETKIERLNITISKNVESYQVLGSGDVDSLFNKQFIVTWDFDALFENTTLLGYVQNDTTKWMKIVIENGDVDLWWAVNPSITLIFTKVGFETRDQGDANNDIIRQTIWFTALYDNDEWYSAKCTLVNGTASY